MSELDQRAKEIFQAALKLPPKERAAYLDRACGSDAQLRQRIVEALFQAQADAAATAQAPVSPSPEKTKVVPFVAPLPTEAPGEKVGDKIGRYELLEKKGEGGMGTVWVARQTEPVRRKVALKVIKLGMDTKEVVGRFEAERQALALMDHPNIAKVLDAGATETGRPYFVMELVEGIPITEYCDQAKVPTRERLELFVQVCRAIQHAHNKAIIHRDITPSNILVTVPKGENRPMPKVIDFGIAKAIGGQVLTEKTLHTAAGEFWGKPTYVAPEQAEMSGLDIDTKCDIYSLGVLLYELLTGLTPFDWARLARAGRAGILKIIREEEPPRPSTKLTKLTAEEQTTAAQRRQTDPPRLISLIRGDLDCIVMRCLEKDRTRRFETANGLARDVERYLNHEVVDSRPPNSLYRLQKLVRRNKLAFAAASAIAVALVAGMAISAWGLVKANRSAKRAQAEAAKSRQVARFLGDMLKGVGPSVALGRDTSLLREILDQTADRVGGELQSQPEVEGELRYTLGEVYFELGELDRAESMHRRGLELRRKSFGDGHPAVALSMSRLGTVLLARYNFTEAEDILRKALTAQRRLLGGKHPDTLFTLNELSVALNAPQGAGEKRHEAEALLREALSTERKVFGENSVEVADTLAHLAEVLKYERKLDEAEAVDREALAIRRKSPKDQFRLASSLGLLADALGKQNKLDQAEALEREALSIQRKVLNADNPALALRLSDLANLLEKKGKLAEAESFHREALAIREKALGRENEQVGQSLRALGAVLDKEGKLADAETAYRDCVDMCKKVFGAESSQAAAALSYLGAVLDKEGKLSEAETVYREGVDARKKSSGAESYTASVPLSYLGDVLFREGKLGEAESVLRDCLAIRNKTHSPVERPLFRLYTVLQARGSLSEPTIVVFREATEHGDAGCCCRLGFMYARGQGVAKDSAEAVKWYRKAADQGNVSAQFNLGRMYERGEGVERDPAEAAKWFGKVAEAKDPQALNDLAWSLATSRSAEMRDGPHAVTLAEIAVAATNRKDPRLLDTLAAAYAEAGDFTKANSAQKEAIGLLVEEQAKKDYAARLKLYEANTPYRQGE